MHDHRTITIDGTEITVPAVVADEFERLIVDFSNSELLRELSYRYRDELQAIVDEYPKTTDGVPKYPGMTVYFADPEWAEEYELISWSDVGGEMSGKPWPAHYSTLAAAEAARNQSDEQPQREERT